MRGPVRRLLAAAIVALGCTAVRAAEVENVEVSYERGEYRVTITAILAAPIGRVHAVLTDYPHWPEINDLIKESVVESGEDPDRQLVRTVTGGCVAFFCKRFVQVQWMRAEAPERIMADVLPERSDLRHGWARTRLTEVEGHTHFHYEMALAPRFWVPPLIGPLMIQHKLRRQAIETAENVERIAAGDA